jgi:hypothetical protein
MQFSEDQTDPALFLFLHLGALIAQSTLPEPRVACLLSQ